MSRRAGSNQPNIQGLSRQVKQEVAALKCLGLSLLALAITYFVMSIVNVLSLSRTSFEQVHDDKWSTSELYKYTRQLNIMKLAHSCLLVTLTVPIAFLTTRNKVTSRRRYDHLITLTILLELSYIMPLMFAVKRSLDEKS